MHDDPPSSLPVKDDDPPGKATPLPRAVVEPPAAVGRGLESLRRTLAGASALPPATGSASLHAPARDPLAPPQPAPAPVAPAADAASMATHDTDPALQAPDKSDIGEARTVAAATGTVTGLPTSLAAIDAVPTRTPQPAASADKSGTITRLPVAPADGDTAAPTAPADADAPPQGDDLTGMLLSDRYRLEKRIGEGAMGAVYRATHTHIKKRYAIKVLHPNIARDKELQDRFKREAMAAAHIEHPNVCTATDFGETPDGMLFLVMEYLDGQPLEAVIEAEKRLDPPRVVHIVDQIASALMRAHALDIVHRDLKPDNVFLVQRDGEQDIVKIVDFGIAHVYLGLGEDGGNSTRLTQAGMVYGTPHYLSPEQAAGEPVTARSDLYSLGIMMYEMLCGKRPFEGGLGQLLAMHMTRKPPPFAEAAPELELPPVLERIVMRLLAKMPADRTASAEALRAELAAARLELGYPASTSASGILYHSRSGDVPVARLAPSDAAAAPAAPRTAIDWRLLAERGTTLARTLYRRAHAQLSDWIQRGRAGDLRVLIGAGVVLMAVTILLTVLLISGGKDEAPSSTSATQSASPTASAAELPDGDESETPPDEPPGAPLGPTPDLGKVSSNLGTARLRADKDIAAAYDLLDSGFAEAGLARLEQQRERFGRDADFLLLLADAYGKAGSDVRALEIIGELIDLDPSWLDNEIVARRVLEVFSQDKLADARPAKDILLKHMTPNILEQLYAMALDGPIGSRKNLRKRIEEVLIVHGKLETQPDWWRLSFDLRLNDKDGCIKRRDIVEKLRNLKDPRALPTVRLFHEDPRNNRCSGMPALLEETVQLLSTLPQ